MLGSDPRPQSPSNALHAMAHARPERKAVVMWLLRARHRKQARLRAPLVALPQLALVGAFVAHEGLGTRDWQMANAVGSRIGRAHPMPSMLLGSWALPRFQQQHFWQRFMAGCRQPLRSRPRRLPARTLCFGATLATPLSDNAACCRQPCCWATPPWQQCCGQQCCRNSVGGGQPYGIGGNTGNSVAGNSVAGNRSLPGPCCRRVSEDQVHAFIRQRLHHLSAITLKDLVDGKLVFYCA